MKKIKTLLLLVVLTRSALLMAVSEPVYASDETREIVLKMIEAHGGFKNWKSIRTFSFQNTMFSASLGERPFWINEVTVDPKTRRVYQDWLSHDATMAYNGNETWSENWKIGNAPKFEALFFYYFLNLPWLTQDAGVTLSETRKIMHNSFENEVYVIEMGFIEKPAIGKTKNDTYKLYIDSENYLLVGYEYSIGYGYMLDLFGFPPERNLFGPMFRINDSFVSIEGLIYPNLMHTGNTDMTEIYGNHAIVKYNLDKKFDNSRMKKSEESIVDTSSDNRKKNN